MDELMRGLAGRPPTVTTRRSVDRASRIRRTLRTHYARKREHYGLTYPDFYERDLRRLFSDAPEHAKNVSAWRFIARVRRDARRMVAGWTGEYQYTIDRVIESMMARAKVLNLRLKTPEEQARMDFLVLLTVQTLNYLHSGRHRVAL
jgi:hypothetical protein